MFVGPCAGKEQLRKTLSFDKVVPEFGYLLNNVVLCIYKANAVKQDLNFCVALAWTQM